MQPASHYSAPYNTLDVAIMSLVMDLLILGPIILFSNTPSKLPVLTFIVAVVLIACCFLVKMNGIQGDNAAFTALLKKMAEDHSIAMEAEKQAQSVLGAAHKRTQEKLRGKLLELGEARSKASQTQAGLRASEAKNRSFINRLVACADERDTAVARLVKARAQRDTARREHVGAEEEAAVLTEHLASCAASVKITENELAARNEQLSSKQIDNVSLAQSLQDVAAERDAANKELDAKTAAMVEQGVRISEGAMHMVGQTKVIAELRDLLGMSRDRINYLGFELEVRLQCATSMKAEVVRLTDEVAFLQRSMRIHDSAASIKMGADPDTASHDSTGSMSSTPSTSSSSSSSSSVGITDSTWNNVEAIVISPPAPPSPANDEAVQEFSSSRSRCSAIGMADGAASSTSIDDSTRNMPTNLSPTISISSGNDSDSNSVEPDADTF